VWFLREQKHTSDGLLPRKPPKPQVEGNAICIVLFMVSDTKGDGVTMRSGPKSEGRGCKTDLSGTLPCFSGPPLIVDVWMSVRSMGPISDVAMVSSFIFNDLMIGFFSI
jgi:hypothetical protein